MPPPTAGRSAAARARDQLFTVLAPVVEGTGHDLEDVTVGTAGRRSVVRVVVDADGGVDLDSVAEISRAVSEALDGGADDGVLAGAYVLEVSSPGVDRPLTAARHWRRAVGRMVSVPVDGASRTGRVAAVTDSGVVLDVADVRQELPWERLGPGRVQVEFNRDEFNRSGPAGGDAGGADREGEED
jgi:ribosome maturation factor RimP